MNRLKAYYCADVRKTNIGIRFNGERCGAVYSFTSPLLQRINAFLTRYTSRASSFVKSDCEFIRGYVPQKSGGYTSFAIVPYGSTFTVPEEVKQQASPTVRLNIIGVGYNGLVVGPLAVLKAALVELAVMAALEEKYSLFPLMYLMLTQYPLSRVARTP